MEQESEIVMGIVSAFLASEYGLKTLLIGLAVIALARYLWHGFRIKFSSRSGRHLSQSLREWMTEPQKLDLQVIITETLRNVERRQLIFGYISDAFWFSVGLATPIALCELL